MPIINKTTFVFSNVEDPDEEIKFQKDERDVNHLLSWLDKARTIAKVINIIKPIEMERQWGLLSIKEDLSILKAIAESNGEPIDINFDNQFKPEMEVPTPKPCFITPRSKETERYLRNQGEIHWLLFEER